MTRDQYNKNVDRALQYGYVPMPLCLNLFYNSKIEQFSLRKASDGKLIDTSFYANELYKYFI